MMTNHNFCAVNRTKGRAARNKRERLKRRQNNRCHWCSIEMTEAWTKGCRRPKATSITIDHVVPLGDGGSNHDSNCVAACDRCNNRRNTEAARANMKLHRERQARLQAMEIELNGGQPHG